MADIDQDGLCPRSADLAWADTASTSGDDLGVVPCWARRQKKGKQVGSVAYACMHARTLTLEFLPSTSTGASHVIQQGPGIRAHDMEEAQFPPSPLHPHTCCPLA